MANTRQSVVKHVLTEGDRIVVGRISPLGDQGGYAIAINYGTYCTTLTFSYRILTTRIANRSDHIPTSRRNAPTPFLSFPFLPLYQASLDLHNTPLLSSSPLSPGLLTPSPTYHPPSPPPSSLSPDDSSSDSGNVFNILHPLDESEWDFRGFSRFVSLVCSDCKTG